MTFNLPPFPYEYSALEPFIDEETMKLHHDKHHATYVEKLNAAIAGRSEFENLSIEDILSKAESLDESVRQAVINHGGGHANHSFFWKIMTPPADSKPPQGKFNEAVETTFGSFDILKEKFSEKAMGVFGSGWAFLIMTPEGKLNLKRQSFQNSPLMRGNLPILGIDVWEHAYYLKYQNRRDEYIKAWWNVVNWKQAEKNFLNTLKVTT